LINDFPNRLPYTINAYSVGLIQQVFAAQIIYMQLYFVVIRL